MQDFGAEPYLYQQGKIHHVNSRTSRFTENSRATVNKVDICVFVMVDGYGDITWNHELNEALQLGKPFVLLALESAWMRYNNLHHSLMDPGVLRSEDDRQMVDLLRMISSDYQITVTPFTYLRFQGKAPRRAARRSIPGRSQARSDAQSADDPARGTRQRRATPTRSQVDQLIALAADEYEENKLLAKVRAAAFGCRRSA